MVFRHCCGFSRRPIRIGTLFWHTQFIMSQSLTKQEMQRANQLRARDNLNPPEAAELNELLPRADSHEAELLAPHTRALQAQNEARAAENRQLAALVERRQRLANQLAEALQTARAERRAIDLELQSILQAPAAENSSTLAGANR